jgi:hypothetical protein
VVEISWFAVSVETRSQFEVVLSTGFEERVVEDEREGDRLR